MANSAPASGTRTRGRKNFRLLTLAARSGASMTSLPRLHQILRPAIGDRHNRKHGVEPAIRHMHAAVDDVQVVQLMHPAIFVDHGCLRIVTHTACARLMLAAAGNVEERPMKTDRGGRARFLQPGLCFPSHELSAQQVVRMMPPRDARHRNPPCILHLAVNLHSRFEHGPLLHGTHDGHVALEIPAHEIFMSSSPSRNSLSRHSRDYLVRRTQKLISQKAAADKSRIPMIKVADCNRSSRSEVVVSLFFKQASGAGVGMPLQIPPYPVVAIA